MQTALQPPNAAVQSWPWRRQRAVRAGMRPQAANPSSQAQPAGQPRAQPSSTPGSLLHMLQQTARLTAAVAAAAALGLAAAPPPAAAVLSNPSMLLPRTAEVALRRAIPAFNLDVRNMQSELEQIRSKLRIPARKPWGSMRGDAAAAAALAEDQQALLAGVPPGDEAAAAELVEQIQRQLARLLAAIDVKDATRTSVRLANSLELVARLELLQAPGLPYQLPRQVAGRPILTGRAVVEVEIETGDGRRAFLGEGEEGPQRRAALRLVLDGFSAPVTAGNFAANVADRVYDGQRLAVTPVAVLAGAVQPPGRPPLPLEILAAGDFEPTYRVALDVGAGERPVLPLSVYGSLAMVHLPGTGASGLVSPESFFIYLFDRQSAGLAGLDFAEGEYGVFGFATKGLGVLPRIHDGDRIASARIVEGADKLVRPAAAPQVAAAAAAAAGGAGGGEASSPSEGT